MTPQQQAALEALAGRPLGADTAAVTEAVAAGDHRGIAAILSVGRTKTVPTEVGNGTVLEVLGLTVGNALLDVINSAPDFRHVKPLLEQGRLRLDSPMTQSALASLVPAVLTAQHVSDLVARCTQPDPVTHPQVSAALEGDSQ